MKKNYKLQFTNYKQFLNYKIQITKKDRPFGKTIDAYGEQDKREAAGIATYPSGFYLSPIPNKQYQSPMDIFNIFVILNLWFVCNLYFVICNFVTPLPSIPFYSRWPEAKR